MDVFQNDRSEPAEIHAAFGPILLLDMLTGKYSQHQQMSYFDSFVEALEFHCVCQSLQRLRLKQQLHNF